MTQGCDQTIGLGLVSAQEFRFLLNTGTLFNNEMTQHASGVLACREWYRLHLEQPEGVAKLFGEQIYRPIMFDENSMSDVAEGMIDHDTFRWGRKTGELKKHAKLFDGVQFSPRHIAENDHRGTMHTCMTELVKVVNKDGVKNEEGTAFLLEKNSATIMEKWLSRRTNPDDFRLTEFRRQIVKQYRGETRRQFLALAVAIHLRHLAQGQCAHPSLPDGYTPFILDLERALGQESTHYESDSPRQVEIGLNMAEIAMLPLKDIIELRKVDCFDQARTLLGRVRIGGILDIYKLQQLLNKCGDVLSEFVAQTSSQRSAFLKKSIRKEPLSILRVTTAVGAGAGVGRSLVEIIPCDGIVHWVLRVAPIAGALLFRLIQRSTASGLSMQRTAHRATANYNPIGHIVTPRHTVIGLHTGRDSMSG